MKEVLFNTHDLVLFITIYQCVLFALFLLTQQKIKRKSNVLLAFFLLSYAAIPLDTLINFGESFRQWAIDFSPNIFYVFGSAYWLEAVLLLFYVRSVVYDNYELKPLNWLYFLPFLCYIIYEIVTYYSLDDSVKLAYLQEGTSSRHPNIDFFFGMFREIFRLTLGVFCMQEVRRYQKQIKNEFASIESIDLTWLKILVIGFLVIRVDALWVWFAWVSSGVFTLDFDFEFFGLASNYTVMFLISSLIFFSLSRSPVFSGISSNPEKDIDQFSVEPEQIAEIIDYMQKKQPYLNCLLNLNSLADQLSMSPRSLSNVINRQFNQNFFEFINGYRIEESKRLLSVSEHKNTTILDIMGMAGFNSKATFNTLFKKKVGMTPSQYKNT